jgi:hypothetical protein
MAVLVSSVLHFVGAVLSLLGGICANLGTFLEKFPVEVSWELLGVTLFLIWYGRGGLWVAVVSVCVIAWLEFGIPKDVIGIDVSRGLGSGSFQA